jgi:hypothetical protein
MRVSLAPSYRKVPGRAPQSDVAPLRPPDGARVILGHCADTVSWPMPIAPRADTLFGLRSVCLAAREGSLFVCDTGRHRLLIFQRTPGADNAPADWLMGQPDFCGEGRNGKGAIAATTLNVPIGVVAADGVLAVADPWNHRVLLWHKYPQASNRPADVVIRQKDFTTGLANRGESSTCADTLNWCYGVTIASGRLFVADTGNRRVLVWNEIPTVRRRPADLVLGQSDFSTRDENAGQGAGALGMGCHDVAVAGQAILVTNAGDNRIMVRQALPQTNGAPCDFVIGQTDARGQDHNQSAYYPSASALNMPNGLFVQERRLIVADTANSRLLGFEMNSLSMGAAATRLAGQNDFADKADNRWRPAARDSLCWPYGVSCCNETLVIADSGNNRVLLGETAP